MIVETAAKLAEAAAGVESAGEGIVAAVFAGFANLEAASGFSNNNWVRLGGRLSLTVVDYVGDADGTLTSLWTIFATSSPFANKVPIAMTIILPDDFLV